MIRNLGENGRVHDMGGVGEEDGIAVGRGPRRLAGPDVSTAAGDIFDVELFAEMLAQLLSGEPREHIGQAARGEWHDRPHLPCRIGLRHAIRDEAKKEAAAAARCKNCRRGSFIVLLL